MIIIIIIIIIVIAIITTNIIITDNDFKNITRTIFNIIIEYRYLILKLSLLYFP